MSEMTLSVLTCGEFGRSIAAELTGWRQVALDDVADRTRLKQIIEGAVSESSEIVFATWRERQDIGRVLDGICNSTATPWLSVVAEHPWVRIGPGIMPGRTPCYKCFRLRRLQHDRNAELSLALQAAYSKDLRIGVRGHLPHQITIAAGLVAWVRNQLRETNDGRSPVTLYHTLRHEIACDYVTGIHDCDVCGWMSRARSNDAILACIQSGAKPCTRSVGAKTEAKHK